jgi:MoaA/NifB/PqqE/SkfB family radical SAM enzyme
MIGTAEPQQIELKPGQRFYCTWPWETVVLMSDGTVVCGCADPFKKRPAGNAALQSISEIWNGRVFRELRRGFHTNNPHLCTHCNLIQVVPESGPKPPEDLALSYLPRRLFVEPCISCNLSCLEACCNHENGIHFTRHNRLLDYDLYTRVIDEIGSTLFRVDFFNYGETFIHPKAVDMISYAKSRYPHIYFFCSTNGLLLNTEEKLQRLVRSGIDELTFSIDGAKQDSYQIYRRGGDFNKVFQIMKRLVEVKKEQESETPFINWRYILFRWNDSDEEMNLARQMAAEIDIDKLCWEITDHPENSASERFIEGKPEYERIRHEIWSALGNAMPQKTLHATIKPKGSFWRAKQGEPFQGELDVMNSGGALWKNASQKNRRHVTLGIQLLNEHRQILNRDFARLHLPRPLSKGERETFHLKTLAPKNKGRYWLKFDMVCEGIEWFESCGSEPAYLELQVQ